MAMRTFDSIGAAQEALFELNVESLPEDIRDRFKEFRRSPSPVDAIVRTGELLYAKKDDLPKEALEVVGGLIGYATFVGRWHGLGDGRGQGIVMAIARELEERMPGFTKQKTEDDPAPLPEYANPVPTGPMPVIEGADANAATASE